MARALFLVSTGRTGTTWMEHCFSEAGARAFHEPGPAVIRHVAHAYASGHLSDERARALLLRWRRDALADRSAPYVEASTLVYGLARPILDTFPDAHVVHVVRNPLSFLKSGMNWGQYRLGGRPLNLAPFRRLAPPQFEPAWKVHTRVQWAAKDQFARLCWAWTAMNRVMREQTAGHERASVLAYERLFDAATGPVAIRELLGYIGLELDDEHVERLRTTRVNENRSRPDAFPSWPEWSVQRLAQAVDVCGQEAARYGYDLAAEVLARRPDVERLLTRPVAATPGA